MNLRPKVKAYQNEAGFTLVELMVVLVIFGLLASVAVLSFPSGSGALEKDAQIFAARMAALRDNAILQSRPMAVQVTQSGYSFLQRRKGMWDVLEDKPFQTTDWSEGIAPMLEGDGALRISFESTGLPSDQAEIILYNEDRARRVAVDPLGDIKMLVADQ